MLNNILQNISSWCGITMPRIFFAFIGILMCTWIVIAIWERRTKLLPALAILAVGMLMVVSALDPRILQFLASTSNILRIRLLMGVVSFVVLVITIESIRRSHLQERYALLWVATGIIILFGAFFPKALEFISVVLGTQYTTSVIALIFIFLILVAFHFSISLSGYHDDQIKIAQRCAILEARIEALEKQVHALSAGKKQSLVCPEAEIPLPVDVMPERKSIPHGALVAIWSIIGLSAIAVLITGFMAPDVMVGDEVTHYFIMQKQASDMSKPCFSADVPMAWGETIPRRYPHVNGWHYIGAVIYNVFGKSFHSIQVYHALFFAQLMIFAFLLAKARKGTTSASIVLYLLSLASLPICLMFSVIFYQDVPVAAQVLTAFYFLRQRRWLLASIFMFLSILIKDTALVMIPAFLLLMALWMNKDGRKKLIIPSVALFIIVFALQGWFFRHWIRVTVDGVYYPAVMYQKLEGKVKDLFKSKKVDSKEKKEIHVPPAAEPQTRSVPAVSKDAAEPIQTLAQKTEPAAPDNSVKNENIPAQVTPYEREILSTHPGDLRNPKNFLLFGGGIIWLVILVGIAGGLLYGRKGTDKGDESSAWLWGVGLWYLIVSAYILRTAPDARFFLPGLPFILLPLAEFAARIPKQRFCVAMIGALAILQSWQVLQKAYTLRKVTPELIEAVQHVKLNTPVRQALFMYPEGNYRLFTCPHDWYLDNRLREFWKADNDKRIEMLIEHSIGMIVIKKYLIAPVDEGISNLGVYPDYFVRQIDADKRFEKVFDNSQFVIYRVPR